MMSFKNALDYLKSVISLLIKNDNCSTSRIASSERQCLADCFTFLNNISNRVVNCELQMYYTCSSFYFQKNIKSFSRYCIRECFYDFANEKRIFIALAGE